MCSFAYYKIGEVMTFSTAPFRSVEVTNEKLTSIHLVKQ